MKKSGLFLLYFLYVFNCSFIPLPYFLRTRVIFGLLGLVVILLGSRFKAMNKYVLGIIVAFSILFVPIIISSTVNLKFDIWLTQYVFLSLFHFVAAYLIVLLSLKAFGTFSIAQLITYIVGAVVANSVLAVGMFFIPAINNFFLSIQNFDDQSEMVLGEVLGLRLVGLGIGMFFMGGLIWGVALLLIAYLIKRSQRVNELLKLSLLYIVVMIIGIFIARTALVGAALGVVYICWPERWNVALSQLSWRRGLVFFGVFLAAGLFGIVLVTLIFPDIWDSAIISWAFELFMALDDNGGLRTGSTEHLGTMYIWPDNVKTWLVGDGLFNDEYGYYMDTDVGYLRLIYYFGVFGTIMFFLIQCYLFRVIVILYDNLQMTLLMFFALIYVLILNLKGFADVNAFMFLFFWFAILQNVYFQRRIGGDKYRFSVK